MTSNLQEQIEDEIELWLEVDGDFTEESVEKLAKRIVNLINDR